MSHHLAPVRFGPATLCMLAIAVVSSCGVHDDGPIDADHTERPQAALQAGLDGAVGSPPADVGDARVPPPPVTLARPDGAYSVAVTANGMGCPAGTWSARIMQDGELAFQLSSLELVLDRKEAIAIKDCTITLRLRSAAGRAYAVRRLHTLGFAYLDQDVRARVDVNATFAGTTPAEARGRVDVVGPYDGTISLHDEPPAEARLWSACRTEHTLQLRKLVRLVNSEPRRNGYLNIGGIDAVGRKLSLTLDDRPCDVPPGAE